MLGIERPHLSMFSDSDLRSKHNVNLRFNGKQGFCQKAEFADVHMLTSAYDRMFIITCPSAMLIYDIYNTLQ